MRRGGAGIETGIFGDETFLLGSDFLCGGFLCQCFDDGAKRASHAGRAKRLSDLFQSYTFGFPESVSVKTAGDGYNVTFDLGAILNRLSAPADAKTYILKTSPLHFKLTDQGTGAELSYLMKSC